MIKNDLTETQKNLLNWCTWRNNKVKNLPVVQDFHDVLATQVSHKHPVMSNNFVHVNMKWK